MIRPTGRGKPKSRERYQKHGGKPGDNDAISIRRHVIGDRLLEEHVSLLQGYIDTTLGRYGASSIRHFAVDSLRLTLLPTTKYSAIVSKDPSLKSTRRVQRRVAQSAPTLEYPLRDVVPTHSAVLRGKVAGYVSLLFNEPRVNAEQDAVLDSVGRQFGSYTCAALAISAVPELTVGVVEELNAGLDKLAPVMRFNFEAATFRSDGHL